jgi:hypothetical protein
MSYRNKSAVLFIMILLSCLQPFFSLAQKAFTHADTLRGSITPERSWWDVQRYDVKVTPDFNSKTIIGENEMTYLVTKDNKNTDMQIDLQVPLVIDSVVLNNGAHLAYTNEGNVWYLKMPRQKKGSVQSVQLFYSGKVHEAIRHGLDNDVLFRNILRGLNKKFYHQTVTTQQIEHYMSQQAGFDYQKVFDQYLRNLEIPDLEYYFSNDKQTLNYRYTNCVTGFNLPLTLKNEQAKVRIVPSGQWQQYKLKENEAPLFEKKFIEMFYYIDAKPVSKPISAS